MTPHLPTTGRRPREGARRAWLAIVSGERRGAGAALARLGLTLAAALYRLGLAARGLLLRFPGAVRRIARPVVSIGNLTVGGTGKTPLVALIARLAREMGGRPVIVSRGYAAAPGHPSDEAMELAHLCPDVPHVQHRDRWQALRDWMEGHPCDVAILDDGFQHRRLHRDLDVVLIDALVPWGFGHLLPRGLLREPPRALRRADLVVITRADQAGAADLEALRRRLARWMRPGAPVLAAAHRPRALVHPDGRRAAPESLRGAPVAAACGIGNPEAFRRTLESLGARIVLWRTFPDHHAYTAEELESLAAEAEAGGAKMLVTTLKDFVKWRPILAMRPAEAGVARPWRVEACALEVECAILEGADVLRRRLGELLPG